MILSSRTKHHWAPWGLFLFACFFSAHVGSCSVLSGCKQGLDPKAAAYGAELQICADKALEDAGGGWKAYRDCEKRVDAKYGLDAGVSNESGK